MVGLQKLLKVLGVQKPVEILRNKNPNEANVCSYTSERILSVHKAIFLVCIHTSRLTRGTLGHRGLGKTNQGRKKQTCTTASRHNEEGNQR